MAGHHSGQTLNDRLNAARYALAGQGLARVVCKATTEELIAPKKKHIDYLIHCTNEPNVSIPHLANLLIERTGHSSWVVVFKSLVTVHNLMCYGNERFTQYLASSNSNFQLSNYIDKNGPKGYDMSIFIRRYAKYLNQKALSYRTVAFDFTKIKRGGDGQLRAMNVDKLVKTIPVLQEQIDSLLEFDCNANDLTNTVIHAAFLLLFKDLIRLFACYNDGIINCLEKYFELNNKKIARETLEIYKKFLIRMNKIGEFLKVAETVGIDKGEIPDLTKAPSSLLDAMEQHLAAMEGRKVTSTTNGDQVKDESSVKKAIEEEEQFLNKLKEKHLQEKKVNNPFLAAQAAATSSSGDLASGTKNEILDLFAGDSIKAGGDNTAAKKDEINDLFSLASSTVKAAEVNATATAAATSNPFADILNSMSAATSTTPAAAVSTNANSTNFATSDNFAAAFGATSNSNAVFDAFGDVLQPESLSNTGVSPIPGGLGFNSTNSTVPITSATGGVISAAAAAANNVPSSSSSQSLLKGDLDSSLASLAQNLDINGLKGGFFKAQNQFNSNAKSTMKTGAPIPNSNSFAATVSPAPSTVMWSSMGQPPAVAAPGGWSNPMIHSASWTSAATVPPSGIAPGGIPQVQPIMPMIGNIGGSSPLIIPSAQTLPPSFGMRPTVLPGSVQVLPVMTKPFSQANTTGTAAGGLNLAGFGATTGATSASTNPSIDPFGAL